MVSERSADSSIMEKNLTSGSVFGNIVTFSLPYLFSYFLQTLYGMADLFIIGQFEGTASTTAVSIGSQVMHMLTVMIVGLAMGATVGIGRAIGEAMAIIMVAGNVANMPGLLTPVRFLTTAIASEMSYASVGSLHRNALFSIGLVLFLFIMLINVFLNVFIKRKKED